MPPARNVPHPHSVHLSPDNRFLLVNDLGSDRISVFTVNPATARLGPPALFSNNRPGSGLRHIAFHPNGRWVYSINELDSTIDRFLWATTSSRTDPQGLLVNTGAPVKTIAPSFPVAKNPAAEVAISLDGNFLYASNRGEDSLVVFSIAPVNSALALGVTHLLWRPARRATSPSIPPNAGSSAAMRTPPPSPSSAATLPRPHRRPHPDHPLDSPMFCLFA